MRFYLRFLLPVAISALLGLCCTRETYYRDWNYAHTVFRGEKEVSGKAPRSRFRIRTRWGRVLSIEHLNGDKPKDGDAGWATGRVDVLPNESIEVRFFSARGTPAENGGVHREIWVPDGERGFRVSFENALGKKTKAEGGMDIVVRKFDDYGAVIEKSFYSEDDRPVVNMTIGCHKALYKNDEAGNRIEGACFNVDGRPVALIQPFGFHKSLAKYDDSGNQIEESFFGKDGRPVVFAAIGAHKISGIFDKQGNRIEESYFGIDERPVVSLEEGGHKVVRIYDDFGEEIEESVYGKDGRPVNDKSGVHKKIWRYDDAGNALEVAYFAANERPVLSLEGGHRIAFKYDGDGRMIEQSYFGTDGRPVMIDICHKISYSYREDGKLKETTYFDIAGKKCQGQYINAITSFVYNLQGILIAKRFYDKNDRFVREEAVGSKEK